MMFTILKLVVPNNIKTQIYIQPKNIEQLIFNYFFHYLLTTHYHSNQV